MADDDIDRSRTSWLRRQVRGCSRLTSRPTMCTRETDKASKKLPNPDLNFPPARTVASEPSCPETDRNSRNTDMCIPGPSKRSRALESGVAADDIDRGVTSRERLWDAEHHDLTLPQRFGKSNICTSHRIRDFNARRRRSAVWPGTPLEDEDVTKMTSEPVPRPLSQEQLVAEVKGIYAGLIAVESKCIEVDSSRNAQNCNPGLSNETNNEHSDALFALLRPCLQEPYDPFLASEHPPAILDLKRCARIMVPTMALAQGMHSFVELLGDRLPTSSLKHILAIVCLVYSLITLSYKTVPAFVETTECLSTLGRYRMDEPSWCLDPEDNGWLGPPSFRDQSLASQGPDDPGEGKDYPALHGTMDMILPELLDELPDVVGAPSDLPDLTWNQTMQSTETSCTESAWPWHPGFLPEPEPVWCSAGPWQPRNGAGFPLVSSNPTTRMLLLRLLMMVMLLPISYAADGVARVPAYLTVALAMIATGTSIVSYEIAGKPKWPESLVISLTAGAAVAVAGFFCCYVAFFLPSARNRALFFRTFMAAFSGMKLISTFASSAANPDTADRGLSQLILLFLVSTVFSVCLVESKVRLVDAGLAEESDANEGGEDNIGDVDAEITASIDSV